MIAIPYLLKQLSILCQIFLIGWWCGCLILPNTAHGEPSRVPFDPRRPIADFDLQGFIDKKLAAGEKEVLIPPGRYRVSPKKGIHLRLKNLENITILARGVEMICTETTQAVEIQSCHNLTICGLAIDYDPLPYTQGMITSLGPDKRWVEFKILGGYPEGHPGNLMPKIEIFDGQTEQLKSVKRYDWQSFEYLGGRCFRVRKGDDYKFDPATETEEVGDILVASNVQVQGSLNSHAIVSSACANLVLEDISVFASNCFSYFESNCNHTTYLRCSVDQCPIELDTRHRERRRIRSGNADAFHSKHALRGPQIIGCTAKFMGDDAVNICGNYYMIMGASGRKVRVLTRKDFNIEVGDAVELYSYTGVRLPDANVVAIKPDGVILPEEKAFLDAQKMHKAYRDELASERTQALAVWLDRDVRLPMGSVIASCKHTGNGFLVKDNSFGFNRSRGILIKASDGQIIGNNITSSWMTGILVSPEWWWLESGNSNHVKIIGNTITDCRETAIKVTALAGNGSTAPAGAHRQISVSGNSISKSPLPFIEVTSTQGLRIENNSLPAIPKNSGAQAIRLCNCTDVTEQNNQ